MQREPLGLLDSLMRAFRCLPGVGHKTAQRMAYHLLQRDREGGRHLALTLLKSLDEIGHCLECRTLSEEEICRVCASPRKDRSMLCVVETPAEMGAISGATGYEGLFFVLNGRLSPLDGVGPKEIGLDFFENRLRSGEVREIILATSTTVEGEATAHFIHAMARDLGVAASRLAYGMPLGGELEFVDGATLSHAFKGRRVL